MNDYNRECEFMDRPCDLEELRDVLAVLERAIQRLRYQVVSAEEKLKRVDPLSVEFDATADLLESLNDEISQKEAVVLRLRQKLFLEEQRIRALQT